MKFTLLLHNKPLPAYFNMEFDKMLFLLLKNKLINKNIIRIYQWDKLSISTGKSQNLKNINLKFCSENNIPIVKRPTGGRAVIHQYDFTFSVFLTKEQFKNFSFKNCFLITAQLILNWMKEINIKAKVNYTRTKGEIPDICFKSTSEYEIVDQEGNKISGIALCISGETAIIQTSTPFKNPDISLKKIFGVEFIIRNELINRNFAYNFLFDNFIKALKKSYQIEQEIKL